MKEFRLHRGLILFITGAVLISLLMILTQSYPLLGLIVMPLYLLKVYKTVSVPETAAVYAAGMLPYFTLGLTEGASAALPVLITTAAIIFISEKKLKFRWALALMTAVIIASMIINMMIMMIQRGTDVMGMFREITSISRKVTEDIMTDQRLTLPESQKAAIKETLDTMTPELLFDRTLGFVIQYGLIAAYILLSRSGRMRTGDGKAIGISSPDLGRIKIDPILLLIVFAAALTGTAMKASAPLYRTMGSVGYSMVDFLGLTGMASFIIWVLNNKTSIRSHLLKIVVMAGILMVLGKDICILIAMTDSVMDFRNLTGKSIFRYLMWKIFPGRGEK